ncbi:hypothetical protein Y032_0009g704 [Ancylostoma ceylanicum]|uniref:NTR domain-containing protein n=1 Tax=Ancylostoma ceylanicum TaxID=53326 RepID=A0A016VKV0_9BILA|nr:hypothetical protein Y032_0009g704 [Ancylostoma ceylanicum]
MLFNLTIALVKVESSGATRGDNYEFEVKYEKLFQWWHYWVAEATIISDAPKTLKINQKCGIRLERGQQYVLGESSCKLYDIKQKVVEKIFKKHLLGCTSFSNCHFVRPYKRLTRRERELIQKQ